MLENFNNKTARKKVEKTGKIGKGEMVMQLLFHYLLLAGSTRFTVSNVQPESPVSLLSMMRWDVFDKRKVDCHRANAFNSNRDHEIKHLRMFIGPIKSPAVFHGTIRSLFEHC